MRSGNWLFVNIGGSGWIWQRVDPLTRIEAERSVRAFASLKACIGDAALHGYIRPEHDEQDSSWMPPPCDLRPRQAK
jgi:hypothetical protein